uniref:Uncharacterized protein n=1 Tax=Setaria italica TaxID=4555 RepID=K3YP37_SETIT
MVWCPQRPPSPASPVCSRADGVIFVLNGLSSSGSSSRSRAASGTSRRAAADAASAGELAPPRCWRGARRGGGERRAHELWPGHRGRRGRAEHEGGRQRERRRGEREREANERESTREDRDEGYFGHFCCSVLSGLPNGDKGTEWA